MIITIDAKLGGAGGTSAPPLFLPRPYIISNISTFFGVKSGSTNPRKSRSCTSTILTTLAPMCMLQHCSTLEASVLTHYSTRHNNEQ